MTEKRNAGGRKAAGNHDDDAGPPAGWSWITGRIPGRVAGRESALTRSGEPVKRKKPVIPEPEDKLDAVNAVSGPEDERLDWRQVDWRQAEENVRGLRQGILTASNAGDLSRVRRLQKLMLRSRSNTLISVRRVTERNAGRLTAGVDSEVVLTLRKALIANATALDAPKDVTPLARNEFICRVEDAKQSTARERRIRRSQEELEEGQRQPCCWPGCKHRERTGRSRPASDHSSPPG
jgi:hypothetical protein